MIVIPLEGRRALNWSLWACDYRSAAHQQPQVHAYVTPVRLGIATTRADLLAAEATWPGYAPQPLRLPTDAGPDVLFNDVFTFDDVAWTRGVGTGSQEAIGYWVDLLVAGLTRSLAWCEQFPAPVLMESAGDFLSFGPQFSLGQLQPNVTQYTNAGGGLLLGGGA